jgi:hypothetical protein
MKKSVEFAEKKFGQINDFAPPVLEKVRQK